MIALMMLKKGGGNGELEIFEFTIFVRACFSFSSKGFMSYICRTFALFLIQKSVFGNEFLGKAVLLCILALALHSLE